MASPAAAANHQGSHRPPFRGSHLEQPSPTVDQILLYSFGPDLTGTRTYRELSIALLRAGFSPPLAHHLIRVSPLLHRASKGCYCLRKAED